MDAKHTPGPWVYAAEFGSGITEAPCITTVARCAQFVIGLESNVPGGNYRDGDPQGDEEADARLIAAAPDLLEALKLLLQDVGMANSMPGAVLARAAIKKATGETA